MGIGRTRHQAGRTRGAARHAIMAQCRPCHNSDRHCAGVLAGRKHPQAVDPDLTHVG